MLNMWPAGKADIILIFNKRYVYKAAGDLWSVFKVLKHKFVFFSIQNKFVHFSGAKKICCVCVCLDKLTNRP